MPDEPASSPRSATSCLIREATAEDAAAIERLYRELVSNPHVRVLPEQVTAILQSPVSYLLVAESSPGEIQGSILLTICPDTMYGAQPFGVLENVIVSPASRGGGIGRRLLAEVERLAVVHDCTKLMLLSAVQREAAHAFFRHCGFRSDTKLAFVKYRSQFATS